MTSDNFWGKFRRWRRQRPFWGGLFLLLAALELLYTANMNLAGLQLHLGPQGFLSYLLPLLLIICGLLCWFTPAQRMFYGIIGLLTALYSFVGLNLGGFFGGMLLGILGGALIISWGPPKIRPGLEAADEPPDGEPAGNTATAPTTDAGWYGAAPTAGPDDRTQWIGSPDDRSAGGGSHRAVRDAATNAPAYDREPPPGGSWNPKALAIGLVALGVSATVLVAGSRAPASAEDCPADAASRSAATATAAATSAAPSATARPTAPAATGAATAKVTPTVSPTPATSPTGSGNPLVDGFNGFIDGVGNLLGLGDKQSAGPSTSPAPSVSPSPAKPAADPTTAVSPTASAKPTPSAASPTASSDDLPCLGPRQYGKVAAANGLPPVAAKFAELQADWLTMTGTSYDGVVELPTAGGGTIRALKFSMDQAVNTQFSLTITDPNGTKTVIKSDKLTVSKHVEFYTTRFEGWLVGLFPMVFTPENPPGLMLPALAFHTVKVQLNYIRCDELTGEPLKITATK